LIKKKQAPQQHSLGIEGCIGRPVGADIGQEVGQQLLQGALALSSRLLATSSHRSSSSRVMWDVLDLGVL